MKRETRAARTRSRILARAADCFRRLGYQGCSVDEIASEAGVSKPTVYNHFGSKDGLFEALARAELERLGGDRPVFDPARPPGEQLLDLARARLAALGEPDTLGLFRAVLAELMRRPEWAEAIFAQLPEEDLAGWLRAADAAGVLRVPHPARSAALFWGLVKGPLFYPRVFGLPAPRPAEAEALLGEAVRVFVAGHA